MSVIFRAIKNFFFWSYERGSWQYDVMVAAILAFIFLTPRHVFHERPTPAEAHQVQEVRGPDGHGYRVEARLLAGSARGLQISAEQILEEVTGRSIEIKDIQPVLDARGHVVAYNVWVQEEK